MKESIKKSIEYFILHKRLNFISQKESFRMRHIHLHQPFALWLFCQVSFSLILLLFPQVCGEIHISTMVIVGKNSSSKGNVFLAQSIENVNSPSHFTKHNANSFKRDATRPLRSGKKIPQVSSTYSYYSTEKGVMNEHQLMIGASTSKVKQLSKPLNYHEKPPHVLEIQDLLQLLAERCITSKEALDTLIQLVEQYGFSDEDPAGITFGESVALADPNEAWILNILPGLVYTEPIWIAKRIQNNEIATVANSFTIRNADCDDDPNNTCIFSKNVFQVAKDKSAWKNKEPAWNGNVPFDFYKIYSDGSFYSPTLSTRRMWRVYDLVAPSYRLSPNSDQFPFAVIPDYSIGIKNMFSILRDHYEMSDYDLTEGIEAGPFHCPYRYNSLNESTASTREKSISSVSTTYSFVLQATPRVPKEVAGVFWYAPAQADASVFVPCFPGLSHVPSLYSNGNTYDAQMDSSAWKLTNFISSWSALQYQEMQKVIQRTQHLLELKGEQLVKDVQNIIAGPMQKEKRTSISSFITSINLKHLDQIFSTWTKLSSYLVGTFNHDKIKSFTYPSTWSIPTKEKQVEKEEEKILSIEEKKILSIEEKKILSIEEEKILSIEKEEEEIHMNLGRCVTSCCKMQFHIADSTQNVKNALRSYLLKGGYDDAYAFENVLVAQGSFDSIIKSSHRSSTSKGGNKQIIYYGIQAINETTSKVIGISQSRVEKENQNFKSMDKGENYMNLVGILLSVYGRDQMSSPPTIESGCDRDVDYDFLENYHRGNLQVIKKSFFSWNVTLVIMLFCALGLLFLLFKGFFAKRTGNTVPLYHEYEKI